jgi:hypothetical protein
VDRIFVLALAVTIGAAVFAPEQPEEDDERGHGCLELPISPESSPVQNTPVILVLANGEMLCRGEAVPTLAALDALLATWDRRFIPEPWKMTVVLHGNAEADAGRVVSISKHLEQRGYTPLFSMQGG